MMTKIATACSMLFFYTLLVNPVLATECNQLSLLPENIRLSINNILKNNQLSDKNLGAYCKLNNNQELLTIRNASDIVKGTYLILEKDTLKKITSANNILKLNVDPVLILKGSMMRYGKMLTQIEAIQVKENNIEVINLFQGIQEGMSGGCGQASLDIKEAKYSEKLLVKDLDENGQKQLDIEYLIQECENNSVNKISKNYLIKNGNIQEKK